MYRKIDINFYKQVEEITDVDYELNDYIPEDTLVSMIQDLVYEYNILQEKYNDLKQDMEDNYVFNNKNPYNEYDLEREF